VACLLGAAILFLFPLRGQRLMDVQKDVLELHQQKQQAFKELEQA
jgi:hypothetical protein